MASATEKERGGAQQWLIWKRSPGKVMAVFTLISWNFSAVCGSGWSVRWPFAYCWQIQHVILGPSVRGWKHKYESAARCSGAQQFRRLYAKSEWRTQPICLYVPRLFFSQTTISLMHNIIECHQSAASYPAIADISRPLQRIGSPFMQTASCCIS